MTLMTWVVERMLLLGSGNIVKKSVCFDVSITHLTCLH
jgi:hypothetical protein